MKSGFVPKEKAPDELIAGTERGGEVPRLRLVRENPAMADLAQGSVVAGYRIEAVLGRGGMGVVYLATQLSLDRPVALKVIAPELAGDVTFRERFKRESRIAASIEHPNVIPVYEAGEGDGLLYLTMRYVEGTDLKALLEADGTIEPARAARLLAQVAAALAAAHRRDLMHRDVKPANVLVDRQDGREHAYLTDFGIARHVAATSALTQTGSVVGTIDYLAPERIIEGGGRCARRRVRARLRPVPGADGQRALPAGPRRGEDVRAPERPVPDARELNDGSRPPWPSSRCRRWRRNRTPGLGIRAGGATGGGRRHTRDPRCGNAAGDPADPRSADNTAGRAAAREAAPTDTAATEPAATEPAATEPAATEPAATAAHRAGADRPPATEPAPTAPPRRH